jgi:hypothetical protein
LFIAADIDIPPSAFFELQHREQRMSHFYIDGMLLRFQTLQLLNAIALKKEQEYASDMQDQVNPFS